MNNKEQPIIYQCLLCNRLLNENKEPITIKKDNFTIKYTYCKACQEYVEWEDEQNS